MTEPDEALMRAALDDEEYSAEALRLTDNLPDEVVGHVRFRSLLGGEKLSMDNVASYCEENARARCFLERVSPSAIDVWMMEL